MHSYSIDGTPHHEVATKSKGAKNPTRPTNLKDMEANGWLPSVTEYLRVLSNPGLEEYKLGQALKAAYACPPIADEDYEPWAAHIREKAGMDAGGAADLGSEIHASLETYFKTPDQWDGNALLTHPSMGQIPAKEFVLPAIQKMDELGIKVVESELVLTCPQLGYAGTTDVVGQRGTFNLIADFKSKRTKPGKTTEPNESHPIQIAAYIRARLGSAFNWSNVEGFNIYISTTEIGRVEHAHYAGAALRKHFEIFEMCLAIFRYRHFDARKA